VARPGDAGRAPGSIRILGLDPGSRRTGYGIVDKAGSRLRAVADGLIDCRRQPSLAARLAYLCRELALLVRRYQPDAAVLEALYHGVNPRSLIVLAQARGALISTLALEEVEIAEYSPAEVKTALTGNGRAGKIQVARMVRLVLGLDDRPLAADTTDALAAAICYAERLRMERLRKP